MARIHGTNTRIYVNQYNLSGRTNVLDLDIARPAREVTAFEDAAETFVAGKNDRGWTCSFRAANDMTTGEIDDILNALVANANAAAWGLYFDGSAAGSRGYEGYGLINRETLKAPAQNAHNLDADVRGTQLITRAMKLNEATVITGTGNQTGQNHWAGASGDTVLFVPRIIAVTGSGSVTFKLQQSADNSSWNDVVTAVAQTALGIPSTIAQAVAAGVVGPWFRVVVTAFSGFTNVTLRAGVGIAKGG